jgi:hypothetical protein
MRLLLTTWWVTAAVVDPGLIERFSTQVICWTTLMGFLRAIPFFDQPPGGVPMVATHLSATQAAFGA